MWSRTLTMWRLMSNPNWMMVSTYLSTRQTKVGCSQHTTDSIWSDGWLIFQFLCRYKLKFVAVPSDDSCQPVYENPPAKYNAEWIIKILLQLDETTVCYVKPSAVTRSASYVVDVRNLQNQDDIKKDEFGIWNYSGSHSYKVYYEDDGYLIVENVVKVHLELTCYFFAAFIVCIPPTQISSDSFLFCQVRCECACICLCVCVWGEGQHYVVHTRSKN